MQGKPVFFQQQGENFLYVNPIDGAAKSTRQHWRTQDELTSQFIESTFRPGPSDLFGEALKYRQAMDTMWEAQRALTSERETQDERDRSSAQEQFYKRENAKWLEIQREKAELMGLTPEATEDYLNKKAQERLKGADMKAHEMVMAKHAGNVGDLFKKHLASEVGAPIAGLGGRLDSLRDDITDSTDGIKDAIESRIPMPMPAQQARLQMIDELTRPIKTGGNLVLTVGMSPMQRVVYDELQGAPGAGGRPRLPGVSTYAFYRACLDKMKIRVPTFEKSATTLRDMLVEVRSKAGLDDTTTAGGPVAPTHTHGARPSPLKPLKGE
jgi:hypothetical protein